MGLFSLNKLYSSETFQLYWQSCHCLSWVTLLFVTLQVLKSWRKKLLLKKQSMNTKEVHLKVLWCCQGLCGASWAMAPLAMPHYTDSNPVSAILHKHCRTTCLSLTKEVSSVKVFNILEAVQYTEKTWASVTDRKGFKSWLKPLYGLRQVTSFSGIEFLNL